MVRRGLAMVRNIIVVFTVVRDPVVLGHPEGRGPPRGRAVGFAISVKRQAKRPIPGSRTGKSADDM
ncbi:hypothetical protein GCM10010512_24130 [Streptomyces thermoviolaceus subsp. thermoviolaceus]|nr:hypothetical protein GCM10010512_24130 [Streptomyces thermoviolaceus subsp. thermoviolaceus]